MKERVRNFGGNEGIRVEEFWGKERVMTIIKLFKQIRKSRLIPFQKITALSS